MTVDTVLSWVFFLLAGVVIVLVLVRLRPQQKARRELESQKGMEGPAIAVRTRIRERFVYLWIAGVIVVLGGLQVLPHQRFDGWWWIGTVCVLSVPVRMILAILAADRDTEEALRSHAGPP